MEQRTYKRNWLPAMELMALRARFYLDQPPPDLLDRCRYNSPGRAACLFRRHEEDRFETRLQSRSDRRDSPLSASSFPHTMKRRSSRRNCQTSRSRTTRLIESMLSLLIAVRPTIPQTWPGISSLRIVSE